MPLFLPGNRPLLSVLTANNSAQLDFTAGDANRFLGYEIWMEDLMPATDAVILQLRTSADNGASFMATANYHWRLQVTSAEAVPSISTNLGASGDTRIALTRSATSGIDNVAGNVTGVIRADCGPSTMKGSHQNIYFDSGGAVYVGSVGEIAANMGSVNGLRFFMSAGNITSGFIRVFGVPRT